VRKRTVFI